VAHPWVSGPDGKDLNALMLDTQNALTPARSKVEGDAAKFYSDAYTWLAANSPYLAPGWESAYNTLTADINTLATDCQEPTAPPS
jgi:hypothetical protein